jgi:hypothetical protein
MTSVEETAAWITSMHVFSTTEEYRDYRAPSLRSGLKEKRLIANC